MDESESLSDSKWGKRPANYIYRGPGGIEMIAPR